MTTRLLFDIEANGFLYDVTQLHCICAKDLDTRQIFQFPPDKLNDGLQLLSSYDIICGHNICGYDIPAIKKLYPDFTYKKLRDSLCMSKLFNPERPSHSIESYGLQFNRYKVQHEDWTVYSEEMLHRCSEDVEINVLTYNYLVNKYCKNWDWSKALDIEQEFMLNRAAQELEGVDIDVEHAKDTLRRLDVEIESLDSILLERIPSRIVPIGNVEKGCLPFKKEGNYTKQTLEWFKE